MNVQDFNNTNFKTINRNLTQLREEHGLRIKPDMLTRDRLVKIAETAGNAMGQMRASQGKYHKDPQYAKSMRIKTLCEALISEGMYSHGPRFRAMEQEINDTVRGLMDRGYTDDEASMETMNRCRMNPDHAFDDSILSSVVKKAIQDYMALTNASSDPVTDGEVADIMDAPVEITLPVVNEMTKACGLQEDNMDAIEERVKMYASACGKSRNAIVEFLNAVGDKRLPAAIAMLEGKCKSMVGESTEITKEEEMENMFKDVIAEMLNEEVNMDEAEVVMATQGIADDIQDVNEKIGRMVNEDIVAISDKIRNERGADEAQGYVDSMTQALNGYMEAGKQAKAQVDQVISGLSGGAGAGIMDTGADPMDDLGGELDDLGDLDEPDLSMEPEMDDNVDAAAGPVEEPLGRAEL